MPRGGGGPPRAQGRGLNDVTHLDAENRGGAVPRAKSVLLLLSVALCAALVVALLFFEGPPARTRLPADAPRPADVPRPPLSLPSGEGAWMVVSAAGGGFDGKGLGAVAANSSGEVAAALPAEPTEAWRFSCKTRLGDEDLRGLARAVSAARAQEWAGRYTDPENPDGCCDQIGYVLELRRRGPGGDEQVYAASWYGASAGRLPEDLRALQEAAESVRAKALDGCQGTSAAR